MNTSGSTKAERDAKEAFAAFVEQWPAWRRTAVLDDLRRKDYARLDSTKQIYLDYTGAGLYAESQVRAEFDLLARNVFGNPHSNNPTSLASTARVDAARRMVLEFFKASPDEYFAIFTSNASGALKLVGESYPFDARGRYLLTFDNHNSVNGIREFARARGAAVRYVPLEPAELRVDRASLTQFLAEGNGSANRLFAYPAQSNFSGVQHPLDIVDEAQAAGWDVLLDAAAFAPSNQLDLSRCKPDFVAASFYKMFGYPSGVGCLLMRREMFQKLRRPWFAGGTIRIASVQGDGYFLASDAAAFEDGTLDFLHIPAVETGLRYLASIGMDTIHQRVQCLTGWLISALTALRHPDGSPLARIHGPSNGERRGGTIALTLLDRDGAPFDIRRIEDLACDARISLRTGCFCNPGAGEVAFGLTADDIAEFFNVEHSLTFDELRALMLARHGKEIGAIRISVGLASTFEDAFAFVQFLRSFIGRARTDIGTESESRWHRDTA